jgi:plastocyanin
MGRGTRTRRIGAVALAATMALAVGVGQAGGAAVGASNYSFKPKTLTIKKGAQVTWKRVNGSHTVTFRKGTYDKSINKAHPTRTRTFKRRGTFRYYCRNHSYFGMKGKVVVD